MTLAIPHSPSGRWPGRLSDQAGNPGAGLSPRTLKQNRAFSVRPDTIRLRRDHRFTQDVLPFLTSLTFHVALMNRNRCRGRIEIRVRAGHESVRIHGTLKFVRAEEFAGK